MISDDWLLLGMMCVIILWILKIPSYSEQSRLHAEYIAGRNRQYIEADEEDDELDERIRLDAERKQLADTALRGHWIPINTDPDFPYSPPPGAAPWDYSRTASTYHVPHLGRGQQANKGWRHKVAAFFGAPTS